MNSKLFTLENIKYFSQSFKMPEVDQVVKGVDMQESKELDKESTDNFLKQIIDLSAQSTNNIQGENNQAQAPRPH